MNANNVLRRILQRSYDNRIKISNLCSFVAIPKDNKQTNSDILMNKFKYASNTKEVLDTFYKHKDVMNSRHIMQALRSVFTLQKEGRSELSTKSIISSKKFEQLCGRLKSLAGTIDSNETIDALKAVTFVGVPKNSTIVLVLLQLLRHNVNDLNLHQIMFLDFLLRHYEGIPLADAIKMALPIIFDIQLPTKMDSGSIHSLKDYLYFASKNQISDQNVDLICSKILNSKERYDAKTAKSFLWSLSDLKPKPCFEILLKRNFQILVNGMNELSFNELDMVLKKVSIAYTNHHLPYFRNKLFCDSFVEYVMDKNVGVKDSTYVLRKLSMLSLINTQFIDYVSNKLMQTPVDDKEGFYDYYVLLRYLTKTDYRPKNWDNIIHKIENIEFSTIYNLETVIIARILAYHGIFKEKMISTIFEHNFDKNSLNKSNFNSYLTLYHAIKLFRDDLTPKNFDPEMVLNNVSIPTEFPLEGALFSAFGGENYVKSGWLSKEAIFIDHAIMFRKGGYPVSTNFTSKFIEDQDIPEDNEMVLVMCLLPDAYTEDAYMRRSMSIRLKLLEKKGYTVVPVCWESWQSLLDHEKIPYLVQNIKNKLQQDKYLDRYA